MAFMVAHFEIEDYDAWKRRFESDPVGRRQAAIGHVISRSIDNPKDVFLKIEFGSVDEAKVFLERLLTTPTPEAQEGMTLKLPPTIIEVTDEATY